MPNKFNIDGEAVRKLAELLNETNLTEIEYEVDNGRIRVARDPHKISTVVAPLSQPIQPPTEMPSSVNVTPLSSGSSGEILENHPGVIKSPMVGTAYLASAPEAPPFVKVGDSITQGQTLLIIEAMKVMTPLKSSKTGVVTRIIVQDASPVEFGEALLIIE